MSNQGIDVDALLVHWVPYVVGKRDSITVAMDWTEFDADGQATIMLSLLSRHGRATPLVWLTVDKAALKNRRNGYEYQVLVRLAEILPADVRVRVVADRGFGDHQHRGLRAGEGHQRAVVPCGQHRRRTRADLDQPLCQALGDRGRFPRHKGLSGSAWGSDRCMSARRTGETACG